LKGSREAFTFEQTDARDRDTVFVVRVTATRPHGVSFAVGE
jgi:hypothetical protein